eukprot:CAMPEP_0170168136 /NCGR_PEP_ID=MMETSP0040_2-20121228/1299_1 /TAXON_ID=641309 /ORGANISM="Lotharella oceanica, Strain CCMP622" /LENGTH=433 /DNA_ID=CAMNT_0010406333 /DNA_START=94 /DNA_END=1396 /DNA_ORIENTATION=-
MTDTSMLPSEAHSMSDMKMSMKSSSDETVMDSGGYVPTKGDRYLPTKIVEDYGEYLPTKMTKKIPSNKAEHGDLNERYQFGWLNAFCDETFMLSLTMSPTVVEEPWDPVWSTLSMKDTQKESVQAVQLHCTANESPRGRKDKGKGSLDDDLTVETESKSSISSGSSSRSSDKSSRSSASDKSSRSSERSIRSSESPTESSSFSSEGSSLKSTMRQESLQCRILCSYCRQSFKASKSTTNGTVTKDLSSINRHILNTCKHVPKELQACLEFMRNIKGKKKKLMMGDILNDDFIKSVLSREFCQGIPNFARKVQEIKSIVQKHIGMACEIFQNWNESRKRKVTYPGPATEKKTRHPESQTAPSGERQWSLIYRLVLGKTKPGYIARRLRVLLPATITGPKTEMKETWLQITPNSDTSTTSSFKRVNQKMAEIRAG